MSYRVRLPEKCIDYVVERGEAFAEALEFDQYHSTPDVDRMKELAELRKDIQHFLECWEEKTHPQILSIVHGCQVFNRNYKLYQPPDQMIVDTY